MKKLGFLLFAAIAIVTAGIVISCSSGGGSGAYQGAGSYWTSNFNPGNTITITKAASYGAATDFTLTASYTRRTDGFLDLTVTSVTGTGGPSVGDKAYALDIPGFALIVKPAGQGKIIPMVVSGNCPRASFGANWVQVTDTGSGIDPTTRELFGTALWDPSAGTMTLPARYMIAAPTVNIGAGNAGGTATCSGGVAVTGSGAKLYLTSSGGAIVDANGSAILAMPATTISSVANLAGNYAGIVLANDGATANDTFPVRATINTSGTQIVVYSYAGNSLTGAVSTTPTATMTVLAADSPSAGFFRGTLSMATGGTTVNIECMATVNAASSGRNAVSCVGTDPNAATKHFNLMLGSY